LRALYLIFLRAVNAMHGKKCNGIKHLEQVFDAMAGEKRIQNQALARTSETAL
jgi:hypothetical protein